MKLMRTLRYLRTVNARPQDENSLNTMAKKRSTIGTCKHQNDGGGRHQQGKDEDEDSATESISTVSAQKRVDFSPLVTVKEIPHRKCMSPTLHGELWFSQEDLRAMRMSCKETLQRMDNAVYSKTNVDDDIDFCPRGLESKTKIGLRVRNINKRCMKKAIFLEQFAQRRHGMKNEKVIAELSKCMSAKAVDEAIRIAEIDYQVSVQQWEESI